MPARADRRPVLPPGTILQLAYLRERIARRPPGSFVEVGVGSGEVSAELLALGWRGRGFDIAEEAVARARARNREAIETGRYAVDVADWIDEDGDETVDLVISSMVIEHLPAEREAAYFARARRVLGPAGTAVVLVPASPRHWGIEDEIAGHLRRYTRDGLHRRLAELGWTVDHLAGLTFPLSNVLLPISNRLVARGETARLSLTLQQRTERTGHRDVPGKTRFPAPAGLLLNRHVLAPLHRVQKAFLDHERALVLYAEARPTT